MAAYNAVFDRALTARSWRDREAALAAAYEQVGKAQNRLELAAPVDPNTRPYHDRPFRVLHAERFAAGLRSSIADTAVRELPLVGAVDQWVDNSAALGRRAQLRNALRSIIDEPGSS